MYIKRHIERTLKNLADTFGAALVTGARQVGKTTLLTRTFPDVSFTTLDDAIARESARSDPELFLSGNRESRMIIDEVQYAPQIFPVIKMRIDGANLESVRTNSPRVYGRYLLTGSRQFDMMQNVTESLAGRVGIANLAGLSLREINSDPFDKPFLPTDDYRESRTRLAAPPDAETIWERIARGDMPELYVNPDIDSGAYYGAYVGTYIERDVRSLTQVGDERAFFSFMVAMAARTGQLLNLSDVARDAEISVVTAKRWLSVLEASNIVYLLRPWHTNITNRAVKTPKLYFRNTGLAAHITGWSAGSVLMRGASSGAFFETFIVGEILKSYLNKGVLNPPLYFYRDKQGSEIDLLILENGTLHPVEIKKSASPRIHDVKSFAALDKFSDSGVSRGPGALVCLYKEPLPLGGADWIYPVSYI
ncbi:MAG: ATP-binding protein [Synergistaceae bacterium]|jgi:predicted AAA+ superfamily ATPase|nr:ATP-binding protein [Synergistaceae bacterium]